MSKGVQIAIAAACVCAALGWILSSSEGTFTSFESVRELQQQMQVDAQVGDRRDLRVVAFVLEGSIRKDLEGGKIWFAVRDEKHDPGESTTIPAVAPSGTLSVLYPNIDLPDLFRDGAPVILEGGFENDQFVARRVMAKCPSKYENAPLDGMPAAERVAVLGAER